MKLQDLDFSAAGCCGSHRVATIEQSDGSTISIKENGDQTYDVTYLNSAGLVGRERSVSVGRLGEILAQV